MSLNGEPHPGGWCAALFRSDDSFYDWQPDGVHVEHGQFSGIVQKLRFSGLVQLAQEDSAGTPLVFEVNIAHGIGLASFHQAISPTRVIGWQLQGNQFRLFVRMQDKGLHGRGASFKDVRARTAASDHAPWFDFSDADDLLGPLLHPRKPDAKVFLHFDPDFVYQTRTLQRSVTTRQLAQLPGRVHQTGAVIFIQPGRSRRLKGCDCSGSGGRLQRDEGWWLHMFRDHRPLQVTYPATLP